VGVQTAGQARASERLLARPAGCLKEGLIAKIVVGLVIVGTDPSRCLESCRVSRALSKIVSRVAADVRRAREDRGRYTTALEFLALYEMPPHAQLWLVVGWPLACMLGDSLTRSDKAQPRFQEQLHGNRCLSLHSDMHIHTGYIVLPWWSCYALHCSSSPSPCCTIT
jgi:hypothetical protein